VSLFLRLSFEKSNKVPQNPASKHPKSAPENIAKSQRRSEVALEFRRLRSWLIADFGFLLFWSFSFIVSARNFSNKGSSSL